MILKVNNSQIKEENDFYHCACYILTMSEFSETPSPEQVTRPDFEKIALGKMQDINAYGFGYTAYPREEISSICQNGLLGTDSRYNSEIEDLVTDELTDDEKQQYGVSKYDDGNYRVEDRKGFLAAKKEEIRKRWIRGWPSYIRRAKTDPKSYPIHGAPLPQGQVYFNITGRGYYPSPDNLEDQTIASSFYFYRRDSYGVLFDLGRHTEDSDFLISDEPGDQKNRYYRFNHTSYDAFPTVMGELVNKRGYPNFLQYRKERVPNSVTQQGELANDTEWGFRTKGRVSPQEFRALLFNTRNDPDNPEQMQAHRSQIAQGLAADMLEIDKDKPDRVVPVYHVNGDMYWPQYIPYEEIKRRVAERTEDPRDGQQASKDEIASSDSA